MLHYTPIKKTFVGKELIQMGMNEGILKGIEKGRIEGIQKGIEKGNLIGKIHATQRFLKYCITPKKKLAEQTMKELRATLKQLEAELKKNHIPIKKQPQPARR